MKRVFLIVLPILLLALSGCTTDPIVPVTAPDISLSTYIEISRNSAVLSATLYKNPGGLRECGFFIGETSDLSVNSKRYDSQFEDWGSFPIFESKITELNPGVTYYYKAFVSDGTKMAFSGMGSFTTPTEEQPIISDVVIEGKVLKARIVDDGGRTIKHAGFCWSTEENPDVLDLSANAVIDEELNICLDIPDLDCDKEYYFRAYADNGIEGGNAVAYSSNQIRYRNDESAVFELESDEIILADAVEEFRIVVNANVDFTIGEPSADWIHKSDITSSQIHTYYFYVDKNDDGRARQAEIVITVPALDRTFIVNVLQAGKDIIEFEDPEFKSYIIAEYDSNGDGKISFSEAQKIEVVSVNTENITSLAGIEHFLNLTTLYCTPDSTDIRGKLTGLDLSNCTKLVSLYCNGNNISSLNIENCNNLIDIGVYDNQLEELNLPQLGNLIQFQCQNNNIRTLELKDCPALRYLICGGNQLENLDLSDCVGLIELDIENNHLKSLDLSRCKFLQYLYCGYNDIDGLDIHENKLLRDIRCFDNRISSINVPEYQYLSDLFCESNNIGSINVNGCINLQVIRCDGNGPLKSLDLSSNKNLYYVDCTNCPLLDSLYISKEFVPNYISSYIYLGPNTEIIYK